MRRALWQEMKMSTRFLMVFSLAFASIVVTGLIWHQAVQRTTEKIALDFGSRLVSQMNNRIDVYFENLDKKYFPVITHPFVSDFLDLSAEEISIYKLFLLNVQYNNELIPSLVYSDISLENIAVVSANGAMLSSSAEWGKARINADQIMEKAGSSAQAYWIEAYVSEYQDRAYFRFIRKIYRNGTQLKGALIVDLDMREIERLVESPFNKQDQKVWIVDSESSKVIFGPKPDVGNAAPEFIAGVIQANQAQRIVHEGQTFMALVQHSPYTKWSLALEIPYDSLTQDISEVRRLTVWVGLVVFMLILWAGTALLWSLTRSLLELQRMMKQAELGNLNPEQYRFRTSNIFEMNVMYGNFKRMVEQIRGLMEELSFAERKEKEMQLEQKDIQLKLMHSQINPHFLYNSLEVINSYAIVENVPSISRMTKAMAAIFRYSVKGEQQVKLAEEVGQIESYLLIQQERYRDTIRIEIDVDRHMAHAVWAIRIMLQPIVENVFKHGYEDHGLNPDYIGIVGGPQPEGYEIKVTDRGGGMSAETLAQLREALRGSPDGRSARRRPEQLGMINVHARIRSLYGPPFGVAIEKSDAGGTVVRILLPWAAPADPRQV